MPGELGVLVLLLAAGCAAGDRPAVHLVEPKARLRGAIDYSSRPADWPELKIETYRVSRAALEPGAT